MTALGITDVRDGWRVGKNQAGCLLDVASGEFIAHGLSKIRPTSAMDGVPILARRDELKCGVAAVDLQRGEVIGLLEFQSAVEEIFEVQLLIGSRFPEVTGFQNDSISRTFAVPPLLDDLSKANDAFHCSDAVTDAVVRPTRARLRGRDLPVWVAFQIVPCWLSWWPRLERS